MTINTLFRFNFDSKLQIVRENVAIEDSTRGKMYWLEVIQDRLVLGKQNIAKEDLTHHNNLNIKLKIKDSFCSL